MFSETKYISDFGLNRQARDVMMQKVKHKTKLSKCSLFDL